MPALLHDGFPEPPLVYSHGGQLDVTLKAAVGKVRFAGRSVTAMSFDGSVPGPALVFCAGDTLHVRLENDLPEATNLHMHGFHVSPEGDHDNVFLRIEPGQDFNYEYDIPNDMPAGSYWYHPHLHMSVERQIFGGLAGIAVEEGGLDSLPALKAIPQRWIVLQNTEVRDGRIVGVDESTEAGDRIYVNGAFDPTARIRPGQLQRWRIFNASADRFIVLRMPHGQRFLVLAEDGHTLARGRWVRDLTIAPGSRRDVLVRGGQHGRSAVRAIPFAQFPGAQKAADGGPVPNQSVIALDSVGAPVKALYPRGVLSHPVDLRSRHVDRERTILFDEMNEPSGAPLFTLNGMTFDPNRTDVVMKLGSVERWTLVNQTSEWHTFHIHTNDFQVVSVAGKGVPYADYEDNVALQPHSSTVILINPTDFTGRFVFHCHVTFHEDHGMMATVEVVKEPSATQARASVVHDGGLAIGSTAYGSRHMPVVAPAVFFCRPRPRARGATRRRHRSLS
ncbi:MAG TPA: multicopper oxidase family protein [Solirubrobacteraceae bacterium]